MRYLAQGVFAAVIALSGYAQGRIDRAPVGSRVRLTLEGSDCGELLSFQGGNAVAEAVSEKAGPDGVQKKHAGSMRFEDLEFYVRAPLAAPLQSWLKSDFGGRLARKNGSVSILTLDGRVAGGFDFLNAIPVELNFRELDASSKDPYRLGVRLSIESARAAASGGIVASPRVDTHSSNALGSNFRLSIPGLDCTKVIRIEPFSIKRKVVAEAVGEARDYKKEPSAVEYSNIRILVAENGAQTWKAWHEDFVVKGNSTDDKEKDGTLEWLDPAFKGVLMRVKFHHLGILRCAPEKLAADDKLRRVEVDLYCEKIELDAPAAKEEPVPAQAKPEAAQGHPDDQGARDPADVPRYPGSIRTSYSNMRQTNVSDERAEYWVKEAPQKIDDFFSEKMKALGWKESLRNESGDPKKLTYEIDARFERENKSVRIVINQVKDGGATIYSQITTNFDR